MTPVNQFVVSARTIGKPRRNANKRGTICSGRLVFTNGSTLPFVSFNDEAEFLSKCSEDVALLVSGTIVAWGEPPTATLKVISAAILTPDETGTTGTVDASGSPIYKLPPVRK